MKETTIHSLLIARTLFEKATGLCHSDDRYLASAGLVIIQDAVEMVLYSLLIELGIDEEKSLENKSFDELICELKKAKIQIPKSGTLKSLNKQRVLTKHYAQVAEPITVRNYFAAVEQSLDSIIKTVTGCTIYELFLADILSNGESKDFLKNAEMLIKEKKYLDALIEIRKAIFVEFEKAYSIHRWKDYNEQQDKLGLAIYTWDGWKAPSWTRNKKWIDENITNPSEYIQIDSEKLRIEMMELGIHSEEFQNIRRLTPAVFRPDSKSAWCIKYDIDFPANDATQSNAKYCLDRAIAIILKKQEHLKVTRARSRGAEFTLPPIYIGHNIYRIASVDSDVIHVVSEGYSYKFREVVSGFNPGNMFYKVIGEAETINEKELPHWISGFLLIQQE